MFRSICYIALFALATAAHLSFDNQWESFKAKHNKVYSSSEEEETRRSIFNVNLKKIEAHNRQADNGVHTYRLGVNKFADMSAEEFKATRLGYRQSAIRNPAPFIHNVNYPNPVPTSVDWRDSIVTRVKNMLDCQSSYAFSAVASLESAAAQKTGKLVEFSEQNLVDCRSFGNDGCSGGTIGGSFDFVVRYGIDTEASYPYTGEQALECKFKESTIGTNLSFFVDIPSGDEKALLRAVAERVVSVGLDATPFQLYESGILNTTSCDPAEPRYGVAIVGYGIKLLPGSHDMPYWLVKNSWGSDWGESGYIRIYRGSNVCGIAQRASYPVV